MPVTVVASTSDTADACGQDRVHGLAPHVPGEAPDRRASHDLDLAIVIYVSEGGA